MSRGHAPLSRLPSLSRVCTVVPVSATAPRDTGRCPVAQPRCPGRPRFPVFGPLCRCLPHRTVTWVIVPWSAPLPRAPPSPSVRTVVPVSAVLPRDVGHCPVAQPRCPGRPFCPVFGPLCRCLPHRTVTWVIVPCSAPCNPWSGQAAALDPSRRGRSASPPVCVCLCLPLSRPVLNVAESPSCRRDTVCWRHFLCGDR